MLFRSLKAALHDSNEIALLDAREEVPYSYRHLLMAACVPLSRLELLVDASVPRRSARVVWCDDGEGLAARAAARMNALGYTNVTVLRGGIAAWEAAGYRIYSGVHVPSKAFAEVVEHAMGTPWITVEKLKQWIDTKADIALFDSRSFEEFHGNSIPTAISVPGAELAYRFADMVSSPATTVVMNCGGRTRSIIGAQTLINLGVRNPVFALENGTQGWYLRDHSLEHGGTRVYPPDSGSTALRGPAQQLAQRFGAATVDVNTVRQWAAEAGRTLYLCDVRSPEEFAQGSLPGAQHTPGGQLMQAFEIGRAHV